MIYASIIVEMLRVRPNLVFWLAALVQTALWFAVPSWIYTAPPGDLAETLAVGLEFRLGTIFGPPLPYWLADLAFELAGGRMLGPYLLAQACVLTTLWSLMALGRSIVGVQQAVLAVLLMVGISAVTMPTPDFGPWVLTMPLWSLALLHAWRVIGEGRRMYWFALAIDVGLLLLTSYLGLVLVVLLDLFFIGTRRGRATLATLDPWLCMLVVAIIVAPYALWLSQQPGIIAPALNGWRTVVPRQDALAWLGLLGNLMLVHSGVVLLVALASGWPLRRRARVPVVARHGVDPLGPVFICFFALATPLCATLAAVVYLPRPPLVAAAPVVMLTALAVIVVAESSIRLHRQLTLAYAWIGLLLAPPVLVAIAVTAVPRLLPVQLRVAQPAAAVGHYFGDTFERRTGQPLAVVTGDRRLAALVASYTPSRPRLFIDETLTPWVTPEDIRTHGAVVLWPATDTRGTPPSDIKERYPDLIPEVPQVFERTLQGLGPPMRVGWAVIRPGSGNRQSALPPPQ
jgi:hypothetical protein